MDNFKRVPIIVSMEVCGSPEFIKMFNGYSTVEQILQSSVYDRSEIEDFIDANIKDGKMVWKDEWSPLLWCPNCDLALLHDTCGICHQKTSNKIDLKFPCNPRPIMAHDEKMFTSVGFNWPMDYSIMLNAYKLPEHWGWEIIHGGKVIGDIIQAHANSKFQFIAKEPIDLSTIGKRNVTIDQVINANSKHLDYLEKEAIAFTNSYKQRMKIIIPVLGFSGGKDSVVLAHIISKTKFARAYLCQINTGIEPKSNEVFSKGFLKNYKKFNIKLYHSKDIFWRAIEKLGPQAFDFQWCRTILKNLAAQREKRDRRLVIAGWLSNIVDTKVLVLHGARNREEPERVPIARTLKLSAQNAIMPKAVAQTVFPLAKFTDLDIWMYIHSRGLPVNPTYTEGKTQRQLCSFCFEKNDYEFENDIKEFPDMYSKLEAALRIWQKKLNFPDEWVTKRLWRYNDSDSTYIKSLGITPRTDDVIKELGQRTFEWVKTPSSWQKSCQNFQF